MDQRIIELYDEFTHTQLGRRAFMERLAVSYNINIIGGSHPTRAENGDILNIAYVFLRDGEAFLLGAMHGLDHVELAAALDISPDNARARLSRARSAARA